MNIRICIYSCLLLAAITGCEEDSGSSPSDPSAADTEMDPSGGDETEGSSVDPTSDGSGSGASTTGNPDPSAGADTADLDEVEDACEADCEAQLSTGCANPNQNVLTCKLQCAAITVTLGDFCLSEYTAAVQCRADGGYDCVNEFPTPRSTCAAENVTYQECAADIGCKRYCDSAVAAGCGGGSFEACFDACQAQKAALPEFCGIYYDSVPLCQAQGGVECVNGQPQGPAECGYAVANVADCIVRETDDVCQGYCYAAEAAACGDGCMQDCNSRLSDMMCGSQWDDLVDCQLRHGTYECNMGRLVGVDICDSYEASYQTCMAGG